MKKLTQKEVRSWMVQLAQSQGFYGRLLRDFNNAEAYVRRNFMSVLPSKNLIVKTKTKKSKSAVLAEVSKFFKKKYGLVIEMASIEQPKQQKVTVEMLYKMGIDMDLAEPICDFMNKNGIPRKFAHEVEENTYSYENIWEMIDGEGILETLCEIYDWTDDYSVYSVDNLRVACEYGDLDIDEVIEAAQDFVQNNSPADVYFEGSLSIFIKTYELEHLI